jgi:hypothetical protein
LRDDNAIRGACPRDQGTRKTRRGIPKRACRARECVSGSPQRLQDDHRDEDAGGEHQVEAAEAGELRAAGRLSTRECDGDQWGKCDRSPERPPDDTALGVGPQRGESQEPERATGLDRPAETTSPKHDERSRNRGSVVQDTED